MICVEILETVRLAILQKIADRVARHAVTPHALPLRFQRLDHRHNGGNPGIAVGGIIDMVVARNLLAKMHYLAEALNPVAGEICHRRHGKHDEHILEEASPPSPQQQHRHRHGIEIHQLHQKTVRTYGEKHRKNYHKPVTHPVDAHRLLVEQAAQRRIKHQHYETEIHRHEARMHQQYALEREEHRSGAAQPCAVTAGRHGKDAQRGHLHIIAYITRAKSYGEFHRPQIAVGNIAYAVAAYDIVAVPCRHITGNTPFQKQYSGQSGGSKTSGRSPCTTP